MKKSIILKITLIMLFMYGILMLSTSNANAASVSINNSEAKVGSPITISVVGSGVQWRLKLKVNGQEIASSQELENFESNIPINFSGKYTPTHAGSLNVEIEGSLTDITGDTTTRFSSKIISVKAVDTNNGGGNTGDIDNTGDTNNGDTNNGDTNNQNNTNNNNENPQTSKKSSNANLSNLGIRPNDFKGFKAGKTTYTVNVSYDVEEVTVYANVQDSKATIVSGTGRKNLKEGTNQLKVLVRAEDGTEKTYTINVVRSSEDEGMVPNVVEEEPEEEKPESLRLTAISLQNDLNLNLSPIFNSEIFEYNLEVESDIDKIELSGIPSINNSIVEIKGNENLVEGENIITITVKLEGYEDVIYKIKVLKKIAQEVVGITEEENEIESQKEDNSNTIIKMAIAIAIILFVIVAIVVMAVLKKKKCNKRLSASYEDYYNDYQAGEEENNINEENPYNYNGEDNQSYDGEIAEGYTAEIWEDEEYEEKTRKRRAKGKHF